MDISFDHPINDLLEVIKTRLQDKFKENIKAIILYGSWVKGTAKKDSDIDLLVVFNNLSSDARKVIYEIEREISHERSITIVPTTVEEFRDEKNPLFTAVKREGKIIYGDIDMTINPESPKRKYKDYFERSKEFETHKVEMAERIFNEYPYYGSSDLCYLASKHAIQIALAMKGLGYSSKIGVLLPLAKEHLGEEFFRAFKKLLDLYIKSEYNIERLSREEVQESISIAKKILNVCYGDNK